MPGSIHIFVGYDQGGSAGKFFAQKFYPIGSIAQDDGVASVAKIYGKVVHIMKTPLSSNGLIFNCSTLKISAEHGGIFTL